MLNKKLIAVTLAGVFAVCGLAMMPTASAMDAIGQEVAEAAPATIIGTVQSVGDGKFTLAHGADDSQTTEVKVNADTKYILDGADSSKDEVLKEGARVAVTHKAAVAITIAGVSQ